MNLTEEQRRKINQFIAEKRGWTDILYHRIHAGVEGLMGTLNGHRDWLPDYTRSLDACHKAVHGLLFSRRNQYREQLREVMSASLGGLTVDWSECIDATAEQRALALFQTLGGVL